MFPQPMPRSEFHPDDSSLDSIETLEQHLLAGFPPDLALDLVLNELVVRAAGATRATAAALALARGDEMVCRAATGYLAPDLGVPLNIRDGLSGACLQTRQPQLSVDTEFDPRIDPVVSRRLGIRSILIVPVFDSPLFDKNEKNAQFAGILEVFSTSPAAFSHADQKLLEGFAEECARVRRAAVELGSRKPLAVSSELLPRDLSAIHRVPTIHPPYETWSLVLGGLAILATIALSFLIGSRVGWLRPGTSEAVISNPCLATAAPGCSAEQNSAPVTGARRSTASSEKGTTRKSAPASAGSEAQSTKQDELVVYEKGKVVFRMKPVEKETNSGEPNASVTRPARVEENKPAARSTSAHHDSIVEASSTKKMAASQSVWLSPTQAESRLLSRIEPQYPPDALAAHRAGTVVLEVHVTEDGSVSTVRTLSGDATLAAAAAEAVRNWRYQPYRQHDHPSQFQTDVTLSFALPN